MSEDLPKQELLLKLLKMTTSSHDSEALVALRKANDLLTSAGWDWDKLIHGKIKVIADPFATVAPPPASQPRGAPQPAYRPAPTPTPASRPQSYNKPTQPKPQYHYTSPPPPRPAQPKIGSTKTNMYAGYCYCCGSPVDSKAGWIFDPAHHNRSARSKLQAVCHSCNQDPYAFIGTAAAPRRRQQVGGAAPSLGDI